MEYALHDIANALNHIENNIDDIVTQLLRLNESKATFRIYVHYNEGCRVNYQNGDDVVFIYRVRWKFDLLDYFSDYKPEGNKYDIIIKTNNVKDIIVRLHGIVFDDITF